MNGKEHRLFILATSVLPLLGTIAAMVLLWERVFFPSDVVALVVMFTIGGLGISTGYHRLLAHRSFKTYRPVRDALVVAGSIAAQGPAITWAAHHRRHHRFADREGDPHSPYHGGRGRGAILKGLWHAHLGWLLDEDLTSDPIRYCPDLVRDSHMRWISIHFGALVGAGLVAPALIGFVLSGSLLGAATGCLWGGFVRMFLLNHTTYAVNSIGHVHGRRRFSTADESRNLGWLALPTFGDSFHNNHHAFPRSASHGMRWYELDVSAVFIRALAATGLAWDVIRIVRHDHHPGHAARGGLPGRVRRRDPPPLRPRQRVLRGVAGPEPDLLLRPLGRPDDDLARAQQRKLNYIATGARAAGAGTVLDIGCGWGSMLRHLVEVRGVRRVVGLTLSPAQRESIAAWADDRYDVRVENWAGHEDAQYDAIVSMGAFEHFARHGMSRRQRLAAYRTFFERCRDWLPAGGIVRKSRQAESDSARRPSRYRASMSRTHNRSRSGSSLSATRRWSIASA